MPPLIAFAGALGGLAVVRWAYRTALRVNGNWKRRGSLASLKQPARTRFRRCDAIPTPARIARDKALVLRSGRKPGLEGRPEPGPHGSRRARCAPHHEEHWVRIALIPRLPPIRSRALAAPSRRPNRTMESIPAHMRPERSFQGFISCAAAVLGRSGLLDPAAVRYGDGSGHFSSRNHAARARAETVEAAYVQPSRRRRTAATAKSKSAAALLSVPGDHQAVAAGSSGIVPEVSRRHRHRFKPA